MISNRIGRYEILRPLGRGAMGVVYLARDPQIERQLALKTVRFDGPGMDSKIDEAKARFLKEARISGRLQHPHIVTVFDVGEDAGNLYLAMEYVAGGSLAQKLVEPAGLEIFDRLRIVAEVAEALGHAHERGVLHRDVKPANILLTESLSAKVSDFGIGKLLTGDTDLTSTGQMVGSPAYMSPEQIRGEKLDVRSDIFSLGVVLYQTLTSRKPFPADTLTTLVYQILHEEPIDPGTLSPGIPEEVLGIIRKCLAKNRDDRYSNAGEFVAEMSAVLGFSPVGSTSTLTESNVRRARRLAGDSSSISRSTAATAPFPKSVPPLPPPVAPLRSDSSPTMEATKVRPPDPDTRPDFPNPTRGRNKLARFVVPGIIGAVLVAWAMLRGQKPRLNTVDPGTGNVQRTAAPTTSPISVVVTTPPVSTTSAVVPTPDAMIAPTPSVGPTQTTVSVVEKIQPTKTPRPLRTKAPIVVSVTLPTPVPAPTSVPIRTADTRVTVRRFLKLNISPDQARVYMDGRYIGVSDDWDDSGGGALLTFNIEGKHRLRFAYPERADFIVDVSVLASATEDRVEIEHKLEKGAPDGPTGPDGKIRKPNYRTVGATRFTVEPAQALVEVNGKYRGPAVAYSGQDMMLGEMGVYEVRLTATGFEPKMLRILVAPSAGELRAVVKEKLKPLK
ncbi:MAG: protein kinase [Thermoanaerobaculia bacterium]